MSAYKKFNSQDVYVSAYTANKPFVASGSQYSELGIAKLPAHTGSGAYVPLSENLNNGYDRRLVYESLHHLYYSGFEKGLPAASSSFENYLQSSFNISGSRLIDKVASTYSIPKTLFGTSIEPKSVSIAPQTSSGVGVDNYVSGGYHSGSHIETHTTFYGSEPTFDSLALGNMLIDESSDNVGHTNRIVDDGEGNLVLESTLDGELSGRKVGNVIYPQGQLIITDNVIARYFNNYIDAELQWKSTHPIYTYNFHCKLKENEFTHTFNPSAISGSNGILAENVAGKEFSPYFTTIGFYNDANELIAIAKPGQPIPIPKDTDMTVIAKLDI